jgi:hypothetical protein
VSEKDLPPEALVGVSTPHACPFCNGKETEPMNAFGSHASLATYWCRKCRSPFEVMKWRSMERKQP